MDWVSILTKLVTIVGILAAVSYYFQIAKILKTKSAKDLSLTMWIMSVVGLAIWLMYGIVLGSYPLIIANTISLTGAIIILILVLKHSK